MCAEWSCLKERLVFSFLSLLVSSYTYWRFFFIIPILKIIITKEVYLERYDHSALSFFVVGHWVASRTDCDRRSERSVLGTLLQMTAQVVEQQRHYWLALPIEFSAHRLKSVINRYCIIIYQGNIIEAWTWSKKILISYTMIERRKYYWGSKFHVKKRRWIIWIRTAFLNRSMTFVPALVLAFDLNCLLMNPWDFFSIPGVNCPHSMSLSVWTRSKINSSIITKRQAKHQDQERVSKIISNRFCTKFTCGRNVPNEPSCFGCTAPRFTNGITVSVSFNWNEMSSIADVLAK